MVDQVPPACVHEDSPSDDESYVQVLIPEIVQHPTRPDVGHVVTTVPPALVQALSTADFVWADAGVE